MSAAMQERAVGRQGIEPRVEATDWRGIAAELDGQGWAVLPKLLAPAECRQIAGLYGGGGQFRSKVVMARHGFGRGE
jgi:hypothetical protein